MGAKPVQPHSPEEHLIFWVIAGTWGLWLLGALYIVGPALAYVLLLMLLARYVGILDPTPIEGRSVPPNVIVWIVGMLAMVLALVIAHLDFGLGMGQTIKSTIGWAKGWALMAIFPLVGALLPIRPRVIVRATTLLGAQTLLLVPVFWLAGVLSLPQSLYVSPLSIIGGSGTEFFDVTLYTIDDTTGKLRWRFFAPWATAVALIACLWFILALRERSRFWQLLCMGGAVAVCMMSGSRLSIVALPLALVLVIGLSNLTRPPLILAGAFAVCVAVLAFDPLMMMLEDAKHDFHSARKASSAVREALQRIAYHRWMMDAPIWGHGMVERGPKLVHYMPIGSHHTWFGLLFVKGIVGFLALAIPMATTFVELLAKAQADRLARLALGMYLMIFLFTFSDNLEIIAYMLWPTLIIFGIAMRRPFRNPVALRFGATA